MKKARKKSGSKKSNTGKIILGLAVLGGAAYAGYQFLYKPMQEKKDAEEAAKKAAAAAQAAAAAGSSNALPTTAPAIETAIQAVQQVEPNVVKETLSPIGTPANKINWGAKIKYGDKGGEVQIAQKLFNAIAKLAGSATIDEDGIYGKDTLTKKRLNFGSVYTITPKQVYNKFLDRKKTAAINAKNQEIFNQVSTLFK